MGRDWRGREPPTRARATRQGLGHRSRVVDASRPVTATGTPRAGCRALDSRDARGSRRVLAQKGQGPVQAERAPLSDRSLSRVARRRGGGRLPLPCDAARPFPNVVFILHRRDEALSQGMFRVLKRNSRIRLFARMREHPAVGMQPARFSLGARRAFLRPNHELEARALGGR